MLHPRACFWIPLSVAIAAFAALIAMGWNGWPGETGVAAIAFCERLHPGPVKQPINTLSNVGFVIAGLWIGWQARSDVGIRKANGWTNPLVDTVHYPASFASLAVLIGAGSSALHASTTRWGSTLDLLSMHVWASWAVAYAASRLLRGRLAMFLAIFGAQVALLVARLALDRPLGLRGSTLFGAMVATAVAIELVGRLRNRTTRLDTGYLVWAVVTFLVAYGLWIPSKTGGPLCDPDSFWQGHAAWHLLCSASVALVYLYGRSERAAAAGPPPEATA